MNTGNGLYACTSLLSWYRSARCVLWCWVMRMRVWCYKWIACVIEKHRSKIRYSPSSGYACTIRGCRYVRWWVHTYFSDAEHIYESVSYWQCINFRFNSHFLVGTASESVSSRPIVRPWSNHCSPYVTVLWFTLNEAKDKFNVHIRVFDRKHGFSSSKLQCMTRVYLRGTVHHVSSYVGVDENNSRRMRYPRGYHLCNASHRFLSAPMTL